VKTGITWKWCGKCQCWTLSHTTNEHCNSAVAHMAVGADASHLAMATGSVSCLTLGGF
jgi:hypothetical protein